MRKPNQRSPPALAVQHRARLRAVRERLLADDAGAAAQPGSRVLHARRAADRQHAGVRHRHRGRAGAKPPKRRMELNYGPPICDLQAYAIPGGYSWGGPLKPVSTPKRDKSGTNMDGRLHDREDFSPSEGNSSHRCARSSRWKS